MFVCFFFLENMYNVTDETKEIFVNRFTSINYKNKIKIKLIMV